MNWAWRQALPPTPKLVLLALADAADDAGVCWPSVSTVPAKAGCSPRTVWRVMKHLVAQTPLVAEPRYRADGSCSSNRYRLLLAGGDRLSPAPSTADTAPGRPGSGSPGRPCHTRNHQRNHDHPAQNRKGGPVVVDRSGCIAPRISCPRNATVPWAWSQDWTRRSISRYSTNGRAS